MMKQDRESVLQLVNAVVSGGRKRKAAPKRQAAAAAAPPPASDSETEVDEPDASGESSEGEMEAVRKLPRGSAKTAIRQAFKPEGPRLIFLS